ncbi:MAG: hypothetical protein KDA17_01385 [Candidatus Saccharibacteria bacterium]|nr:hypothetical protein [Candidatus Saccharibacteria bacterium]
MVAVRGSGWKLAPSLIQLVEEFDRLAPKRSKASDGSIGDRSHQSRNSDHNVSQGWVHAVDITHDPARGCDAHAWARKIAAKRDPRINYIISNDQFWDAARGWVSYPRVSPKRTNKHTSHVHFSLKRSATARSDMTTWLIGGSTPSVPSAPPAYTPEKPRPVTIDRETGDITPLEEEEGYEMKLYRDHLGRVWLWYVGTGERVHLTNTDEVSVWQNNYALPYLDLGPGSIFHNPIVSSVWLKRTKAVVRDEPV